MYLPPLQWYNVPSLNSNALGFIIENSDFDIEGLKVKQAKINEIARNRAGFDFFPSYKRWRRRKWRRSKFGLIVYCLNGELKAVSCAEQVIQSIQAFFCHSLSISVGIPGIYEDLY